jgi:ABC-2 type transport system ATP-binding protein
MNVIRTTELTRRFGSLVAVDGLTLDLPVGGVIGLVGPNGSGKSTLIRMLLGLIAPTSGSAEVLGESIARPSRFASRVGGLIEGPAFVPALSTRANLVSLAYLRGIAPGRVDEVLGIVGLHGREREAVARFSLGMKQRLGIAAALLPDPELLVLDEPTNGLDPAGTVEIRGLLRNLGEEGRTVIVSSHLLSEIEAACDYLVIIRFGTLVFAGPLEELLSQATEYIEAEPEFASDAERLRVLLREAGWSVDGPDSTLRLAASVDDAPAVNRAAAAGGVTLRTLSPRRDTLENVFLRLTGETDGELAAQRSRQVA